MAVVPRAKQQQAHQAVSSSTWRACSCLLPAWQGCPRVVCCIEAHGDYTADGDYVRANLSLLAVRIASWLAGLGWLRGQPLPSCWEWSVCAVACIMLVLVVPAACCWYCHLASACAAWCCLQLLHADVPQLGYYPQQPLQMLNCIVMHIMVQEQDITSGPTLG